MEVLLERLTPPPVLTIFGGGLDVCPLVRMSKELGWHTWIVDPDPACANKGRFELADRVIVARLEQFEENLQIDDHTIAILATHNFTYDLRLLACLLGRNCRYVGIVGPRERSERLLTALRRKSPAQARKAAGRVFAPAGLQIGAETPQENALAILSQIRARLSGR
ncbi:MAG: XdhC family protein [Acidobacteriota bacterium]|nr:XdhC family protein [Acidobacteriota bacterium]